MELNNSFSAQLHDNNYIMNSVLQGVAPYVNIGGSDPLVLLYWV